MPPDTEKKPDNHGISNTTRTDWLGPWPLNLVGRQWRRVTGLTGWRRAIALVGIAVEVVVIIAIIVSYRLKEPSAGRPPSGNRNPDQCLPWVRQLTRIRRLGGSRSGPVPGNECKSVSRRSRNKYRSSNWSEEGHNV